MSSTDHQHQHYLEAAMIFDESTVIQLSETPLLLCGLRDRGSGESFGIVTCHIDPTQLRKNMPSIPIILHFVSRDSRQSGITVGTIVELRYGGKIVGHGTISALKLDEDNQQPTNSIAAIPLVWSRLGSSVSRQRLPDIQKGCPYDTDKLSSVALSEVELTDWLIDRADVMSGQRSEKLIDWPSDAKHLEACAAYRGVWTRRSNTEIGNERHTEILLAFADVLRTEEAFAKILTAIYRSLRIYDAKSAQQEIITTTNVGNESVAVTNVIGDEIIMSDGIEESMPARFRCDIVFRRGAVVAMLAEVSSYRNRDRTTQRVLQWARVLDGRIIALARKLRQLGGAS